MRNDALVTLIDGDSIPWIVAWNHKENNDAFIVLNHVDNFIKTILDKTNAHYYMGFIGGTKCFRYEVAKHKPYKGKRPDKPDWLVKWEFVIKAHMRDKWQFIVVDGIEADDAVSICQLSLQNSTIASTDKDLKQVSGNHYNMRTNKPFYVTDEEAEKFFWKQMITGDNTDNIEGIKGRGPAFADKLIDPLTNIDDYQWAVLAEYNKVHGEEYGLTLFKETLQLIGMLTEEGFGFTIPQFIPWKYKNEETSPEITSQDFNDIFEQWQQ